MSRIGSGGNVQQRFRWGFFLAVFGILFGLMGSWAAATPLYAAPDEASHAVRAVAAVHGDFVEPDGRFVVPSYLTIPGAQNTGQWACYAGQPNRTPACAGEPESGPDKPTWSTAQTNSPVYYAVVGLPSLLFHGAPALYAMRLFSAAVVAALLAALAVLLRSLPGARWSLTLPAMAVTPLLLSLGGSINPNAVEVAATGALLGALLVLGRARPTGWLLWFSGATAIVATALLTGGRSFALLWVVFAGAAAASLLRRSDWHALVRRRSTWIVLAGIGAFCVFALVWFTLPQNGVKGSGPLHGGSLLSVAQNVLDKTGSYLKQAGGTGIFDYGMPETVPLLWVGLLLMVFLIPVVIGRGRARWVTLGLVISLVIVPAATQVALWRQVGDVWQGRYVLALILLIAITGGLALDAPARNPQLHADAEVWAETRRRGVAVSRALFVVAAAGQFAGFAFMVRRYAVGNDSWLDALFHPSWLPPGGNLGLIILYFALTCTAAVLCWRAVPALFVAPTAVDRADVTPGSATAREQDTLTPR